jgi:general secretion pathway protein C
MKERSIYSLSLLALILFFCLPSAFNTWIPGVQAGQDLDWRLVGTATGDDPSKSFAIIEYRPTGGQGVYREGDRLDEVLIRKIMPGYVVIFTGKGDGALSMGFGRNGGGLPSPQAMARLERKEVDSTLPEYMQLMLEIRVRPHFEEGRPAGFLIYSIEPGSIFARMGLQNGDVIMGVNGTPIATTQEAFQFYKALKKSGTVSLQIEREERLQELHFAIE